MSVAEGSVQRPFVVAREARWDVLSSVLPTQGQALLAAGRHAGFVRALFPFERPDAEARLIGSLGSVTGLRGAAQLEGFLRTVEDAWAVWEMSRGALWDVLAVHNVAVENDRWRHVWAAVMGAKGRTINFRRRLEENYQIRCLCDCVEFLGLWVMLGDEGFSEAQLGDIDRLAEVWLTVLAWERVGL